jgi:predicted nucleic acid-binding protein
MAKNKYRLIDSSVVMALFNLEDSQHEKALEVFQIIKKEKLRVKISCITMIELVSLMKYRKINHWQKYAEKLLNGSLFYVDNAYFLDPNDLSWKLTLKEENIGMVDSIEIEHCLQNGEELITFDKKQGAIYQRLVEKFS